MRGRVGGCRQEGTERVFGWSKVTRGIAQDVKS
jgi:hypothetical protein